LRHVVQALADLQARGAGLAINKYGVHQGSGQGFVRCTMIQFARFTAARPPFAQRSAACAFPPASEARTA
jgi:hypothetical protein